MCTATTSSQAYVGTFSSRSLGALGPKFGIAIVHETGVALNATAGNHYARYLGVNFGGPMIQKLFLLILLSLTLCLSRVGAGLGQTVKAFPSAEGFGARTVGGRGGRVIEVTNLNDSGPGSFREAVAAKGPRTVVFRTGGTITLLSSITVINPYLTIAGQTAPGAGITLKNHPTNERSPLSIRTHDVIVRYIRSRPGPAATPTSTLDGIQTVGPDRLNGTTVGPTNVYNIIIDHCSVSWAVDENLQVSGTRDTTIQWNIIAEGLYKSVHPKGPHSRGLLIRQNSQRVTPIITSWPIMNVVIPRSAMKLMTSNSSITSRITG